MPRTLLTAEQKLANKREANRRWAELNKDKVRESQRKYEAANRDVIAAYKARARKENPEKLDVRVRRWREANPDRCREYSASRYRLKRDEFVSQIKAWRQANPLKLKASVVRARKKRAAKRREYFNDKWRNDPQFRMAAILRNRLRKAIDRNQKTGSAVTLLGCSIPDFLTHIERQFSSGMTWNNSGEWHLDHILPLSFFDLSDPSHVAAACHFTNMRPLWARENQSKCGRVLHLI